MEPKGLTWLKETYKFDQTQTEPKDYHVVLLKAEEWQWYERLRRNCKCKSENTLTLILNR